MPSGITHTLLVKHCQNLLPDDQLKYILADSLDFLIVGALGPDLPYASKVDNDFIFSSENDLADNFHYDDTNQIPLRAFTTLKEIREQTDRQAHYQMFAFFIGYLSHVIADGLVHPFIRDMVGNYKTHQSAHRSLEMQLDVLYLERLTIGTGYALEINYAELQDEIKNYLDKPHANETISLFRKMILSVYHKDYSVKKINGWINGMHRLFELAAGQHFQFYRGSKANNLLYKNRKDIDEQQVTVLSKPDDLPHNFLYKPQILYFEDCIEKFYKTYISIAGKAYLSVYENGPALSEVDVPFIDLDTGRLKLQPSLDEIPEFWKTETV